MRAVTTHPGCDQTCRGSREATRQTCRASSHSERLCYVTKALAPSPPRDSYLMKKRKRIMLQLDPRSQESGYPHWQGIGSYW